MLKCRSGRQYSLASKLLHNAPNRNVDLCLNVILEMLEPKPVGLVVTILFTAYSHFIKSQN